MPAPATMRDLGGAARRHPACCGMTHTDAVEDALRTLFVLTGRGVPVGTSLLAAELSVTAPTMSTMLKRLEEHGLVTRGGDHGAELTEHGARHAREVVRRHRLLEAYLTTALGVPWDEVHHEADVLEHVISDALLDRIDALLDHPTLDPHGDPIPSPNRQHVEAWGDRLDLVEEGTRFRVERVYDRDSAALRYLAELGIQPGASVVVGAREPFGGPIWVSVGPLRHALGERLAGLVHGREER